MQPGFIKGGKDYQAFAIDIKEAILCGASSQGKAKTSGSITDETKLGTVRIFLCWH
ncbi:hypothetical protein [Legionella cincinnatiensis]|uniref:hypothetical protein n=1 Tax=Legionella cincinnatiensis TaxID=28085 RepID=UPI000ADFE7A4|nr:hypothetical protein [Legionella cincinnatiensis]